MTQFSGNNTDSESTGIFLFFVNYVFHPHFYVDLSLSQGLEHTKAPTFVSTIKEIDDVVGTEMERAQDK